MAEFRKMENPQVTDFIAQKASEFLEGTSVCQITANSSLIGPDAVFDSMKLVELCLSLEELANDLGFEFDWTSEAAMSRSRGMFRTINSLAEEFDRQRSAK